MTRSEVLNVVERNALEILPELEPGMLASAVSLKDLGADSLDRVEILQLSLEELGLEVPLHTFSAVNTIAGLVDTLWAQTKT